MVTLTFFPRSGPGVSSTTNHIFKRRWVDFMVHGVINPLGGVDMPIVNLWPHFNTNRTASYPI